MLRVRCGWRGWAVVAAAIVAVALALAGRASTADAHPLGNFTINHYDRIEVSESGIVVYSVLDMAEIPAFRERQSIDGDDDGEVSVAEAAVYAGRKAGELRSGLTLRVDGRDVALRAVAQDVTFPEGQGGLLLLRLQVTSQAELSDGWRDAPPRVEFADNNDMDRIGWREIVVRGGAGVAIEGADVPAEDASDELRAYPEGELSSALDVRSAAFSFRPGAGVPGQARPLHPEEARAVRGNPDSTLGRYAELIAKDDLSLGAVALALVAAVGFGAVHALSPGHGKTIVAAYLVGSRGTWRHALLLALTVTATHTSSVYALGFVTLYLSEYIVPERLYPWLGVASGGLILAMGLSLFAGRLRSSGLAGDGVSWVRGRLRALPGLSMVRGEEGVLVVGPHRHGHAHRDGHEHPNGKTHVDAAQAHRHGSGGAHTHAIPGQDGSPVTWRQLVGLGIFGGLLPCPSAIVVMLSAIALHRVGLGLLLIVAFSLGLAAVLSAIGFALVYARAISRRVPVVGRVARRFEGGGGAAGLAVRVFPVGSAVAVMGAGLVVTLRAWGQL
ncbi:MAG: hypothetical protein WEC75_00400 [Dehalococcoidia bacterium]